MKPYQGVLIRYQHIYGLGEFVNVGVLIADVHRTTLHFRLCLDTRRPEALFRGFDSHRYLGHLRCVEALLEAHRDVLETKAMRGASDPEEFFRQIVAEDAGCIQLSAWFGGAAEDLEEEVASLYHDYIGRNLGL